ncbi:PadR family transcriptional regulator [Granulicella sp. S156]|uniref:PadR family transcriptional regulator n=1 Tax=Granulicella sp. S156 TaxID=1747224 RepID=UPI00131A942D|nr:PadR family transcriptional regulator [Granulicella sp. S156]
MREHIFESHRGWEHRESGFTGHRGFCAELQDRYARGFSGREHGGFGHGFGGRGRGGFGRGFGGGRERLFDAGDIKLVILKLLSEQPSYGYQLIKTMEERLSGGYTPSAGVIYPTLILLEEEGLAAATSENNKKVYSVTPEGTQYLETHKERIEQLFERLEETGRGFERGRSPEILKAFGNLRNSAVARLSRASVTPEQIRKIKEAIDAAAKSIDEL